MRKMSEFQLVGRVIFFVTNNVNKFNEARTVLAEYGIAVGMLRVKTLEIQSDSLEEIAQSSVEEAFERCHLPVIVEDAGLFVNALNGFPGPYAAYVYKTVGNKGLLKLMECFENRKATFRSVIAYRNEDLPKPVCFCGEAHGRIALSEKTDQNRCGFGFDPIFMPDNSEKTFAEMDVAEKNKHSHRARAFHKFAEWYITLRKSH